MISRFGLAVIVFFVFLSGNSQNHRVILDTDMDSDVDDVGALAMLHTLADHNVLDILGVIVTSDDKYAPLCVDVINHYFNRPRIPIGVEKGILLQEASRYTKELSREFPLQLADYEDAEDATLLYRRLLASQPDSSVIIITIGHLTNLAKLLESKPDQFSDLTGIELVKIKVKLWSCMGGVFPAGKEANFYRPDPVSTQVAMKKWPVNIVFAGWEIGNKIITGGEYLRRSLSSESPVWRAYQLYNDFKGRQSWDQASILYLLDHNQVYWGIQNGGHCIVREDGSNLWKEGENSNQGYLIEKTNPLELAKIIDALMVGIYSPGF